MEEKKIQCVKCKKDKKESEGYYVLEGSAYCCKDCCGGKEKGENKETKSNICEFC